MAIMTPMFAACQKFDPRCGDSWSRYIEWSGFRHIDELVSTDSMLCPSLIDTLIDADWEFNVHADNRVYFFHDYEYLKRRISYDASRHNLLAISEHPTQAPDPIEAIKIRMADMNLKQKDLIGVIGGKSRVSEVLNRKKRLTVEMIRKLEEELQISASVLIGNYHLVD